MGWIPGKPSVFDNTVDEESVDPKLILLNQKSIKTMLDAMYFERRAFNKHVDASRLFLYKVTRNLMHVTGDTGATLRKTMQAMTVFGVPPEEYWPYNTPPKPDFDIEPQVIAL